MISVLVGSEVVSGERSSTIRSMRKLPIPAPLLCEVHKVTTFGALVDFLAMMVRWRYVRQQKFMDDNVAKKKQ